MSKQCRSSYLAVMTMSSHIVMTATYCSHGLSKIQQAIRHCTEQKTSRGLIQDEGWNASKHGTFYHDCSPWCPAVSRSSSCRIQKTVVRGLFETRKAESAHHQSQLLEACWHCRKRNTHKPVRWCSVTTVTSQGAMSDRCLSAVNLRFYRQIINRSRITLFRRHPKYKFNELHELRRLDIESFWGLSLRYSIVVKSMGNEDLRDFWNIFIQIACSSSTHDLMGTRHKLK